MADEQTTGQETTVTGTDATAAAAAAGEDQQTQSTEATSTEPEGKKDDAPVVPAEYADFTVPEGTTIDTEVLGEFKALAKDLGLPQDKAQGVVNLGVKLAQKWGESAQQQFEAVRADWRKQSGADAEIGGQKADEKRGVAAAALKQFGGEKLTTLLNTTGLGDHPELIRAFYRVGKAMTEDTVVRGTPVEAPKTVADRLYGTA